MQKHVFEVGRQEFPDALRQPWLVCLHPYACRAGVKRVPMQGAGCFVKCLSGEIVLFTFKFADLPVDPTVSLDVSAVFESSSELSVEWAALRPNHVAWIPWGMCYFMSALGESANIPANALVWPAFDVALAQKSVSAGQNTAVLALHSHVSARA
jgi:hypothetical protein